MMLLEISPLVLLLWVVFRLERLGKRLEKVEKKVGVKRELDSLDEEIEKSLIPELPREVMGALNTLKTGSPTKF